MKLSMLDVLPVRSGATAADAVREAGDLAVAAEALGYERVWYAEHHGMASIASAVPELLIASSGARTQRIRLGAGGVMLPNHVPLRVVEQYRTLEALHPGRIDLGIGRAAGTDPLNARALRTTAGRHFDEQLAEVIAFGGGGFPDGHPFGQLTVTPDGVPLPPIWMLGSSGGSAALAGRLGLGYGFAGHFSPGPAAPAIEAYRRAFRPSVRFESPHVILALSVVCAETRDEADELASGMEMSALDLARGRTQPIRSPAEARADGWTPGSRALLGPLASRMVVGDPDTVRAGIRAHVEDAGGADEVMVMTIVHDPVARRRSYELLRDALA